MILKIDADYFAVGGDTNRGSPMSFS